MSLAQAPESPGGEAAGSCLDSSGKTVRSRQSQTNPGRWAEDLERAYRRRLIRRPRLRYRYAALGRRDERVASCARRRAWIECGCGRRQVGGCGVRPLCEPCGRQWKSRLRRRAIEALDARYATAPRRWFVLPDSGRRVKRKDRYRFLTLTVRHSGDIERDRARLQKGWERWRAWWRRTYGYSFAYVGMWEVAPGSRGDGHIHLHLVVLWPWWVDYGDVCHAWRIAVNDAQAAPDIKTLRSIGGAVWYVMRYSSKGLDVSEFSGAVAGDVMATLYARRRVTTSRGFWLPRPICCQTCGQFWAVERPEPLRRASPEIWWRAVVWATLEPPGEQLGIVERSGAPVRGINQHVTAP